MVGGVFVVPPLVASNDLGRVDGRWAEVWHGRRNDDDGTSTADGFGATFLPIFAQDHTLVHHRFTLGTAWRRCGDGLYPLRCSSCRASLWNASLIHCTELSSWEIRWLDCWGQQPIAGLLDRWTNVEGISFWEFLSRATFFIVWLIDWSMWIDWFESVIKACFAVCQDRKSSSKCCKHTRLMIFIMWISCGFHWVEVTVPRCEFVGCGACSQGIRQAELCCTLVQMAHGDHLGNMGQKNFRQTSNPATSSWHFSWTLNMKEKDQTNLIIVGEQWGCCVHVVLPGMTHFGKCWGNVKALQFAFMLSETEMCVFRHLWRESYRRISVATTYRLPVHGWAARVSLCNGRVRSSSSTASHKKSPTWTW